MIRINLLPHREQKKATHRLRFQIFLVATLGAAGFIVILSYLVLNSRISSQENRNQYLQNAITQLDLQIKNIESLKKQRDDLLARKQLVEKLQQSRNDGPLVFDQLIHHTPDGIYLKSFQQHGATFTLAGYALSGAHVSIYMRDLAKSSLFNAPELLEVRSSIVGGQHVSEFSLNLSSKQAQAPATPSGGPGGKP